MSNERDWNVILRSGVREDGCPLCECVVAVYQRKPDRPPVCCLCGARRCYAWPRKPASGAAVVDLVVP